MDDWGGEAAQGQKAGSVIGVAMDEVDLRAACFQPGPNSFERLTLLRAVGARPRPTEVSRTELTGIDAKSRDGSAPNHGSVSSQEGHAVSGRKQSVRQVTDEGLGPAQRREVVVNH
jgi:hypothetical protein